MNEVTALIETNRGDVLSKFHDAVRDFCRVAKLCFTPNGVKLYGQNSAHVAIVQYFIDSANLITEGHGKYKCDTESSEVGIDAKIVADCLGGVACGDLVGLSIDMDNEPDKLVIRCQNPVSGKKSCYKVVIPEMEDDPFIRNPIESCGYNSELVMDSMLFHDMLRDLTKSDADSIRVCCDGRRLVLFANGKNIKAAFEVQVGNDASHFRYTPKSTDMWPVLESISMKYLQKVAKAKSVAQNIHIYLKQDFLLAFSYKTDIGSLNFLITPMVDIEWVEDPRTQKKIMPDPSDDIIGILPRQRSNVSKKRGLPSVSLCGDDDSDDDKKEIKEERERESESDEEEEEEDDEEEEEEKKRKIKKQRKMLSSPREDDSE